MADRVRIVMKDGTEVAAAHTVTEGRWYDDNWITRNLTLRIDGLRDAGLVKVRAFCGDTTMRLFGNSVALEIGQHRSTHDLNWGGNSAISVQMEPALNGTVDIVITTKNFLEPDKLDPRERATILRDIVLAPKPEARAVKTAK